MPLVARRVADQHAFGRIPMQIEGGRSGLLFIVVGFLIARGKTFPVTSMDAVVFVVGNATQTAGYYQLALGMGAGRLPSATRANFEYA